MKKLPPLSEKHMCFGAGPANVKGLRMQFYTDDHKVYSNLFIPEYMNSWQGLVHGGIVSTALDETMFYTALWGFQHIALTREFNVRLHKPARFSQMPFSVVGEIHSRENDTNGAIAGQLFNKDGELCADALGKFALVKPTIIRRLDILTEEDICMIEKVLEEIRF